MSDEEERMALLASMYDDDGEVEKAIGRTNVPLHPTLAMNMVQMSAYVRRLEKVVEEQGKELKRLENDMRRLLNSLHATKRSLSSELDQKIDRRDF